MVVVESGSRRNGCNHPHHHDHHHLYLSHLYFPQPCSNFSNFFSFHNNNNIFATFSYFTTPPSSSPPLLSSLSLSVHISSHFLCASPPISTTNSFHPFHSRVPRSSSVKPPPPPPLPTLTTPMMTIPFAFAPFPFPFLFSSLVNEPPPIPQHMNSFSCSSQFLLFRALIIMPPHCNIHFPFPPLIYTAIIFYFPNFSLIS